GQGVKDQAAGLEPVVLDGQVVDPLGHPELPLRRAGLALFVDGEADDGGAVLPGQGTDAVEAGAGRVPVLQVGGVEDGPAADVLQARFEDGRLRGVEHQRDGGLGGEPAGDLVHVGGAVPPDVVDADVE